ncbi:amino acid-binding protein [Chloroflexota bacterium]
MRVEQVSVFIENKKGRFKDILQILYKKKITLRALLISEASDFCIVRMVLDDTKAALEALKTAGFTTRVDWLLSVEIPDVPGALLNTIIRPLAKSGIEPQYFYGYTESFTDKARVLIKTDNLEKASKIVGS